MKNLFKIQSLESKARQHRLTFKFHLLQKF